MFIFLLIECFFVGFKASANESEKANEPAKIMAETLALCVK